MKPAPIALAAVLLLSIPAAPAGAGVADSPLPLLGGVKSKHVFTVPGVLQTAALATTFVCTSLEKTNALSWAIEIFASTGGSPEGTVNAGILLAGRSIALSVGGTTYSEGTLNLTDSSLPRSARIVATSTRLACTAAVLERQNNGLLPGAGWSLPMIRKTSQKGD
jgi:hypothetical protein